MQRSIQAAFDKWKNENSSEIVKGIIDDIEVLNVKEYGLPFIRADILHESRKLNYRRVYCFSNEVDSINNEYSGELPNNFDIWEKPLKSFEKFESISYEYPIEDTKRAEICHECRGDGEVSCYSCSGLGEEECSSCGGSGRLYCSSCGGDGYCTSCRGSGHHVETRSKAVEWREADGTFRSATEWYDVEVSCSSCGGSGSCHCGDGTVVCGTCGGSGILECSSCYGSGRDTCRSCGGNGGLLEYNSVVQEYIHQSFLECYEPAELNYKYIGLKDMLENHLNNENNISLLSNNDDLTNEELMGFIRNNIGESVFENFGEDIKSLVRKISSNENKKPIMQVTEIFSVPYLLVEYKYNEKHFTLSIDPKSHNIYYDRSPVENYFSGELTSVSGYMEESKYLNAYDMLKKLDAIESSSSSKEDIGRKFNQVKDILNKWFRYGALAGYFGFLFIKFYMPVISYTKSYGFNLTNFLRLIFVTIIWGLVWKRLSKKSGAIAEFFVDKVISFEFYHTLIIPVLGLVSFAIISRVLMMVYHSIINWIY